MIHVPDNHRRGIAATLYLVDKTLWGFRRWTEGDETRSVFYHERNDLTIPQRRRVAEEILAVRELLAEIKETLGIPRETHKVSTAVWSGSVALFDDVAELEGKRLRRYGEPPPELVRYLDTRVADLLDRLQRVCRCAKDAQQHDGSAGIAGPDPA